MSSKMDHKLGHKTSPNKFNKSEIISNIFSDHNAMNETRNQSQKEK